MAERCQDEVSPKAIYNKDYIPVCSYGMLSSKILKVAGLFSKALQQRQELLLRLWEKLGTLGSVIRDGLQAGICSIQSAELWMPCEIPRTLADWLTQAEGYCENYALLILHTLPRF